MGKSTVTLNKFGLTQKDVLQIIILKSIQKSPTHAAQLYRIVTSTTDRDPLSPNRSRSFVYKIIDELYQLQLIRYEQDGRKKIYYLNDKGQQYLLAYEENLFNTIQKLVIIIKQMRETIVGHTPAKEKIEVSDVEKTYISKIINVKVFIQWYVLRRLIFDGKFHGGILYRDLEDWFGWMINHGYFYKVLREMNGEGYIEGRWLDEDTRSKREYEVTSIGKNEYAFIKTKLEKHLDDVEQYLRSLINFFLPLTTS